MSICKTALLLAATCLSISTVADTITINPGDASSATDLFQAATVVNTHSIWANSNPNDAFGWALGAEDPGNVLGNSLTEESWIHFRTASSVSIKQLTISLGEDPGNGMRSSTNLRIWQSTDGGAGITWAEVFSQDINSDYLGAYGSSVINVVATFDTAIANSDWLVRWVPANDGLSARLIEVDASAIPEPATMGLMAFFGGGVFLVRRIFMI